MQNRYVILDKILKSLFTTLLRISSNQGPYFPSITYLHSKHITVSMHQPTGVKPPPLSLPQTSTKQKPEYENMRKKNTCLHKNHGT